jgi:hypothetical protein
MQLTSVDWSRVRGSLESAASRIASLLERVHDPEAPGTGDWDATETAAHLSHTFAANLGAVRGAPTGHSNTLTGPVTEVRDVTRYNAANLEHDVERDLGALASRIEATAREFLQETSDATGDEIVAWVDGAKLPISAVACHWIGESLLHGFDIAKSQGLPWRTEASWASQWFAGFLVPVVQGSDPTTWVDAARARRRRISVDVRVRGAGRALFRLEDGELSVENPTSRRAGCHLLADPAAYFLLTWGRIGPMRAMVTGKIAVWGRRPLDGQRLASCLRAP